MKSLSALGLLFAAFLLLPLPAADGVCNLPPPATPGPEEPGAVGGGSAGTPEAEDPEPEEPDGPTAEGRPAEPEGPRGVGGGEGTPPAPDPEPAPPPAPASPPPVNIPPPPPGSRSVPGLDTGRTTSPRGRGVSFAATWRIWWELNREHRLGLRKTLAALEPVSGTDADGAAPSTEVVREALRAVVAKTRDDSLRATALRALGRVGTAEDAALLLGVLRTPGLEGIVHEGAAIGLASLSVSPDDETRGLLRETYEELLAGRRLGSARARLVAVLALSLVARTEPALARSLGERCRVGPEEVNEAAALLYSCGLSRESLLGAQVLEAALTGRFGGQRLHDVARSHAVLAVAMTGEVGAEPKLAGILLDDRTQVHTRRSTALALGMLLREGRIPAESREGVQRTILTALAEDRDPLVTGYLLVAMGQARPPFGIDVLAKTVDRTGDAVEKPYAALGLGLAVRGLEASQAESIRRFLVGQLERARDVELGAALSIACGLADAADARPILLARAADTRLNPSLRGPAMEALGLLGDPSGRAEKLMLAAFGEETPEVLEDASIGLGFIGHSSSARALVDELRTTKSDNVRVHMVVALSHLGGTSTVRPLLEILLDPTLKHSIRESAAAALGILADPRKVDPLFEIDSCSNPYGLTEATRELVRVY